MKHEALNHQSNVGNISWTHSTCMLGGGRELTPLDKRKKRESTTWTTKIIAMGWALKHETSKHIDTSHVSHVLQRWGTEASKQGGKHLMNTHHFSEGWSLQH